MKSRKYDITMVICESILTVRIRTREQMRTKARMFRGGGLDGCI